MEILFKDFLRQIKKFSAATAFFLFTKISFLKSASVSW